MVHPAEVKRRAKRAELAVRMYEAAARLREHGLARDGFAGLGPEASDAAAELIEAVAARARENVNPRDWEIVTRLTESILEPHEFTPPAGPLPAGYSNPTGRETPTWRRPHS